MSECGWVGCSVFVQTQLLFSGNCLQRATFCPSSLLLLISQALVYPTPWSPELPSLLLDWFLTRSDWSQDSDYLRLRFNICQEPTVEDLGWGGGDVLKPKEQEIHYWHKSQIYYKPIPEESESIIF